MIGFVLGYHLIPSRIKIKVGLLVILCIISSLSCEKLPTGNTSEQQNKSLYYNWDEINEISLSSFSRFDIVHQSAASYGDYAFFVNKGRSSIVFYNLRLKRIIYTLELEREDESLFHCNQCCFGKKKYSPDDLFPLLYISQRSRSDNRCFIEVFRIIPIRDRYLRSDLVQTVYLPTMTFDNSLGNANCVIDPENEVMYIYSRNNDPSAENYRRCKITCFDIPNENGSSVFLEDDDILYSFDLGCDAYTMQGGCIDNRYIYICQGYYNVGFIFLNVIDLDKRALVRRIDLISLGIRWEPEGCFCYKGRIMISHNSGISVVDYNKG